MLKVCSLSSAERQLGIVDMPVESAIKTRRDVNSARNIGNARRGFDEIFSSSRAVQEAREGDNDTRKLADISRARRVVQIRGRHVVRNAGTELGVDDPPTRRCVVPKANYISAMSIWRVGRSKPDWTSNWVTGTPSPRIMRPRPSSAMTIAAVRSSSFSRFSSSSKYALASSNS